MENNIELTNSKKIAAATKETNPTTLIEVFEKLDIKCSKLNHIIELTEELENKLNRKEKALVMPSGEPREEVKEEQRLNIVELFDSIAETIETQIMNQ